VTPPTWLSPHTHLSHRFGRALLCRTVSPLFSTVFGRSASLIALMMEAVQTSIHGATTQKTANFCVVIVRGKVILVGMFNSKFSHLICGVSCNSLLVWIPTFIHYIHESPSFACWILSANLKQIPVVLNQRPASIFLTASLGYILLYCCTISFLVALQITLFCIYSKYILLFWCAE
jgi:hypothetical protein